MISIFKFIGDFIMGAVKEDENLTAPDLDYLFAEIVNSEVSNIDKDNDSDNEDRPHRCETIIDGGLCNYRVGEVTAITSNSGLIDGKLHFDLSNMPFSNLHVGHRVTYLAYRRQVTEEWRVRKILSIHDENWEEDEKDNGDNSQVTKVQGTLTRSIVGQVMHRFGREIVVDPDIKFCLDDVRAEFTPVEGDWVVLEALVEVDGDVADLGGEVLHVDKFHALRSKVLTAMVTEWDSDSGQGIIERDVFFLKESCEPGYMPCVQDVVVTQIIESMQGKMVWRALTVVPLDTRTNAKATKLPDPRKRELQLLEENKNGIVITDKPSFGVIHMGEVKDIVVEVFNSSNTRQLLLRGRFHSKRAESQLSLKSPDIDNCIMIYPGGKVEFNFICKGKFVGHSSELFVFTFKGFKIGRMFQIEVQDPSQALLAFSEKAFVKKNRGETYARARCDQVSNQKKFTISGVRPVKPPAFVPVRLGLFPIPNRMWNAVLGSEGDSRTIDDVIVSAENIVPCLTADLSISNYCDCFHTLLYLEEIEQTVRMRQYDIERAIFTVTGPGGEFMALEVPGLAENRPSLILGDRVLANSIQQNQDKCEQFEGFIHKVCQKEVWLKFHPSFHMTYDDSEYAVSFHFSRMPMRRCHAAVNLALTHLGEYMLFPSSVKVQDPQLIFVEDDGNNCTVSPLTNTPVHQKDSSNHCPVAPEITSVEGIENTLSVEEGKSPIRVPVVERLFGSKTYPSKNNTGHDISSKRSTHHDPLAYLEKLSRVANRTLNGMNSFPICTEEQEYNQNIKPPRRPNIPKRTVKLLWFNKNLNFHQKEAVRNVLKGEARPLPYIIFGPPGTGKTITLVETILQILFLIPDSRLLVATPSNSSANLIAERLLDSGLLRPGILVRLVGYHCLEEGTLPERLVPYCTTGDIRTTRGDDNSPVRQEASLKTSSNTSTLGRHRITVGTCIALGQMYSMGFPRGHFTHVIVDEAGQATEPEILIPLGFLHTSWGQTVLAGDPLQLGPVVSSQVAIHFGLGESFLARLLLRFPYQRDTQGFLGMTGGYNPRLVTRLVMNYRSLAEILTLPSSMFYDGQLDPQVCEYSSPEATLLESLAHVLPERDSARPPALVFHGVWGTNYQEGDCPSWFNPQEIVQVLYYLNKLYAAGLKVDDIGVITPYQKQVQKLRALLTQLEVEAPKIGSVEEFQGQERKVIILSVVRSSASLVGLDLKHALGFVASPRRLNVALTRARALLIVMGNPHLLSQDPYWRSVLTYSVERGAYLGCNLPQDMMEKIVEDGEEKN